MNLHGVFFFPLTQSLSLSLSSSSFLLFFFALLFLLVHEGEREGERRARPARKSEFEPSDARLAANDPFYRIVSCRRSWQPAGVRLPPSLSLSLYPPPPPAAAAAAATTATAAAFPPSPPLSTSAIASPSFIVPLSPWSPEIWNKNRVARRPDTSGTVELGTNRGFSAIDGAVSSRRISRVASLDVSRGYQRRARERGEPDSIDVRF